MDDFGASNFLKFVALLEELQIRNVDPRIADPRRRWEAAVGILGKGGQYIVDRTYNNKRYEMRLDDHGFISKLTLDIPIGKN
jgi:hypothetical protein